MGATLAGSEHRTGDRADDWIGGSLPVATELLRSYQSEWQMLLITNVSNFCVANYDIAELGATTNVARKLQVRIPQRHARRAEGLSVEWPDARSASQLISANLQSIQIAEDRDRDMVAGEELVGALQHVFGAHCLDPLDDLVDSEKAVIVHLLPRQV